MDLNTFLDAIHKYGPVAVTIIFFIWRDYNREKDMTHRIREMEQFQTQKLTEIIMSATKSMDKAGDLMSDLVTALKTRPCIAREMNMLRTDGAIG